MKKPLSILLAASIALTIGVNVAYYNTGMLLKDKVNIISFSTESVQIYETSILYKDIKEKAELIKNIFKSEYITIYHRI